MQAVIRATHFAEEPLRVLLQACSWPEVLQIVTAFLNPSHPKMREQKVLEEAPYCIPRGHEFLSSGVCLEDSVGDVHLIVVRGELGPHVGATEPPSMRNLFRRWHLGDIPDIHSPDFASVGPMPVSCLCFVVSPQREPATTNKDLDNVFHEPLVSLAFIKSEECCLDEIDPLHLELSVCLEHCAWRATEAAAEHSPHVVDKNQSFAIVATADDDVQHIWLSDPGHHQGTLVEQDLETIRPCERRQQDTCVSLTCGHGRGLGEGRRNGDVTTMAGIFVHLLRCAIHSGNEGILETQTWLLLKANLFVTPTLKTLDNCPGTGPGRLRNGTTYDMTRAPRLETHVCTNKCKIIYI